MPKCPILSQIVKKKFWVRGHSPLPIPHSYWEGDTPSPTLLPSAPAAPRPIFANPTSYFFTILTLLPLNDVVAQCSKTIRYVEFL